jgi:hypothetical protein
MQRIGVDTGHRLDWIGADAVAHGAAAGRLARHGGAAPHLHGAIERGRIRVVHAD